MSKNKSAAILTMFLLLFGIFDRSVLAHGGGVSFSKDSGSYVLEFEYDSPQVTEGESDSYIFRIQDKKTESPIVFDSVLVRFENKKDQSVYLVARISPDELQDGAGRVTTMLNAGDYSVSTNYYKSGNKIAEASFDLSVQKSEAPNKFPTAVVLSVLAGVVIGYFSSKIVKRGRGIKPS